VADQPFRVDALSPEPDRTRRIENLYGLALSGIDFAAGTGPASSAPALIERGKPGDVELAKKVLLAGTPGHSLDAFFYGAYHERLGPEVARAILNRILEQTSPDSWWRSIPVAYGNVNWPMSSASLHLISGEAAGEDERVEHALGLLRAQCAAVCDAGLTSEYNSPVYNGVTLFSLATVANYGRSAEARLLAQLLEERILVDQFLRYHPPTAAMSGPYSRSYLDSAIGTDGIARLIYYKELPGGTYVNLGMAELLGHGGDASWSCSIAAMPFHVPRYLQALALKKPLPCTIQATTRCCDYEWCGDLRRGGRYGTYCYMTDEYTLGSAEREYVNHGHSSGVVCFWRKRSPVRSMADFKSLVFKYVVDGKKYGQENIFPEMNDYRGGKCYHLDEGRYHCVQHRGKVICLYQAKRFNTSTRKALALNGYLPLFDGVDELQVGERPFEGAAMTAEPGTVIFWRDGRTYGALRFLEATDRGRDSAIEVVRDEEKLTFTSWNCNRAGTEFSANDYDRTTNGFVLELATEDEFGSLAAFRRHIESSRLEETKTAAGVWSVRYSSGSEELEIVYHLHHLELIERRANGAKLDCPMYEGPYVAESRCGEVAVGRTVLRGRLGLPLMLVAVDEEGYYAVFNLNDEAVPIELSTPRGSLSCPALQRGRILYCPDQSPTVDIISARAPGEIRFHSDTTVPAATLNGEPMHLEQCGARWHATG